MPYSCTHVTTVGVKGLKRAAARTEQCSYDAAESVVNHDVVALLKESNNRCSR